MKLLYEGEKTLEFRLTKNPVTNAQQSPEPLGFSIDSLDPKAADYNEQKQKTLNHVNYSENELVLLKPGINEIANPEHAEYLYRELGNPIDGGSVPTGGGDHARVKNNNIIHEVDEEGNKVEGPFFKKYRLRSGAEVYQTYDKSAFELPEKE